MDIPFIKEFDFAYGRADQLSPRVTRIICNNPGPFTYTGSGTYIVGTEQMALIDPGPVNAAHLESLLNYIGKNRLSHILITHTHADHCGGTYALAAATGARVYAFSAHPSSKDNSAPALDEGADHTFRPDRHLKHGDILSTDEWTLQAIHTPGHISNHLCFALQEEKALFTGDHIMSWATTVVAPPDGDMADYFNSLDLLISRDDTIYYPTHGAPIKEPQRFTKAIKAHRQMRDQQILGEINQHKTKIMDIVAAIYKDVDPRLHLAAALNVEAHLAMHVQKGSVIKQGDKMLSAEYHLKQKPSK